MLFKYEQNIERYIIFMQVNYHCQFEYMECQQSNTTNYFQLSVSDIYQIQVNAHFATFCIYYVFYIVKLVQLLKSLRTHFRKLYFYVIRHNSQHRDLFIRLFITDFMNTGIKQVTTYLPIMLLIFFHIGAWFEGCCSCCSFCLNKAILR